MQFLVITRSREAVGPEMVLPLIERTQAWAAEHRGSGKITHLWAFAGMIGGVAVADVESPEELDEIMTGFPFTGYSSVEVVALTDMDRSLANSKAQVERVIAMMGGR